MRVLVTGATGFVGSWLAEELVRACPEGRLFGTAHGPAAHAGFPASVCLLPCDLTDAAAAARVVGEVRPDRVFHLAGFAATALGDAATVHRVNVEATVHLLRALASTGRSCRVLLVSSGYVYGPTRPGRPAVEGDALSPRGVYAESKAAMEAAARPFAGQDGLSLTVARAFNHTGPRQTPDFVVPAFARQIARIERGLEPPIVRVGNLDAERDFLHVRDVVRAYRLLLEAEETDWRVVNVASGGAVAIRMLLERLLAQARVPLSVETDSERARPSDLPGCVGNPTLLKTFTGWQAELDLERTLAETLDWWRGQIE